MLNFRNKNDNDNDFAHVNNLFLLWMFWWESKLHKLCPLPWW
jgi:hypothetical protein